MTRSLTEAEGRVIALLLANTARDERERLHQSGLARSTYHAVRRRAYQEGWLKDRYIPAPTWFGYPEMTIALVRPFADQLEALTRAWMGAPTQVLGWLSPRLALGVFFHRSRAERERWEARERSTPISTEISLLHPAPTPEGCPVYFDFEGSWTHLSASPGARGYPRGLPPSPHVEPRPPGDWSARQRWAARELLVRPFQLEGAGRAGHLVGPLGLPFAQQRLLAEGWVIHRVLAEPGRLPPYRDRRMERLVFVAGELREGVAAESLFFTLTGECRVYPFLFVIEDRHLLLGALGQANAPGGVGPPEPSGRRAVMPTLRLALRNIQLVEEATASVEYVVDHRFDRLVPPDPEGGASPSVPPIGRSAGS